MVKETPCLGQVTPSRHRLNRILPSMPRLWSDTVDAHRQAVRDATLDATAALVAEHGLRSVTMSQIAEAAGIGRATLYKYFPDVETILAAWHQRQIAGHLHLLRQVRDQAGGAGEPLRAVLTAYVDIAGVVQGDHDTELAAFLHRDHQLGAAQQELQELIRDLVTEAAASGQVRPDLAPDELASYCVHALAAARSLRSKSGRRRLVDMTLAGMQRPRRRHESGGAKGDLVAQEMATDPVCGMQVDRAQAQSKGLTAEHEGQSYYFCGKGCMLDFNEDPDRYLTAGHQPSM
jgi:AcrR family transcriptional regulator/YHS domain-containing protein